MKLTGRDLIKLQWHALLAVFLLLAAGALAYWTEQRAQQAKAERVRAESRFQEIDQRLRLAHSEEQEIKERADVFLQLERSGIAGEEKRLEWIELLRDLQRQLHLPGMSYEFGPRMALDKATGNSLAYHSSHLRIQLRLLHEEDLLLFLQHLEQRAKAMVLVRRCSMTRLSQRDEPGTGLAQLRAECDMDWVSLPRSTGDKQP